MLSPNTIVLFVTVVVAEGFCVAGFVQEDPRRRVAERPRFDLAGRFADAGSEANAPADFPFAGAKLSGHATHYPPIQEGGGLTMLAGICYFSEISLSTR